METKIIYYLKSLLYLTDITFARVHLSLYEEKKSLLAFIFHSIFKNRDEIKKNSLDPQQGITAEILRNFIEYFLVHNYTFISPKNILNGLENGKNYILMTFDDGYYNNYHALEILREYNVPAIFFISVNHIIENKCFWWDVLYRERVRRNNASQKIQKEIRMLKKNRNDMIESYLIKEFGKNALCPIGDLDRPFTPSELKSISKDPLVSLGNHTSNHAILPNYTSLEIRAEILNCQKMIFDITGILPDFISYPDGGYTAEIINISAELGFKLGITGNQKKNYLPLDLKDNNSLILNRFTFWGNKNLNKQCGFFRSDIHPSDKIRNVFLRRNDKKEVHY
jgi:peptidoglycan/xylan/chitin deacetylase (PgdA/CDA1 family)